MKVRRKPLPPLMLGPRCDACHGRRVLIVDDRIVLCPRCHHRDPQAAHPYRTLTSDLREAA